jgi:hypothetical protein
MWLVSMGRAAQYPAVTNSDSGLMAALMSGAPFP